MARPEIVEKVLSRLRPELGDRLREFPMSVELQGGVVTLVLQGAAGSVTALRGVREKLQPVMKKILRDLKLGPKFSTVDASEGGNLVVKVELP